MCAICDNPRPVKHGHRFCNNCEAKLEKEKRSRQSEKPVRFATYKGHVIGFYKTGQDGNLTPRLLRRKAENLPKNKTLDLNTYIEGFTRDQVKKLKSAILQLANM